MYEVEKESRSLTFIHPAHIDRTEKAIFAFHQ
jgi:hypothetical protein